MTSVPQVEVIAPQPGPQLRLAQCPADIAIFGGQAGGGKTFGALLELASWSDCPNFNGVMYRREGSDITNPGGLWDDVMKLYPRLGAHLRAGAQMDATWTSGARAGFRGLQHEKNVALDVQGTGLWLAIFDELTHFTSKQFWYVWSRMRANPPMWSARTKGGSRRKWFASEAAALEYAGKGGTVRLFRPYMRATCNPDPDSWVRKLIDWWIGADGLPIPERDGVIRWSVMNGDERLWFGTEEAAQAHLSVLGDEDQEPISITFIRSTLADNKLGDPNYRRQLASMDAVSRAQLLDGNWNAKAAGGAYFSRMWFDVIETLPIAALVQERARGWDFGGSEETEAEPDPDYSACVRMELLKNGIVCFTDAHRIRLSEGAIDEYVKATVRADGPEVVQCIWQDPGAGGKYLALRMRRIMREALPSVKVDIVVASKNKVAYARPLSARCDPRTMHNQARVCVLRAPWNLPFFSELEAFPPPNDEVHDDWVDAASRAFMWLDPDGGNFATDFLKYMGRVKA